MLLVLQLLKMAFSRPENVIFQLENAVHLTSIRIMRHESVLSVNEGGRRDVRPTD